MATGFQHQRGCPVTYARGEWRYFWGPQTCTCPDNPANEETPMTDKNEPSFLQTDLLPGQIPFKEALAKAEAELAERSFEKRLREIVSKIELGMNCHVRVGYSAERDEHFVQIQCWRMDVITKKEGWGFGGKGWPSPHSTRNEIVQMIFGLYKGYWEHEARENFQYRGRRVFGPHMDVDEIWTVANKVDVRSLKHVEDQDDFPHGHPEIDPVDEPDRRHCDERGHSGCEWVKEGDRHVLVHHPEPVKGVAIDGYEEVNAEQETQVALDPMYWQGMSMEQRLEAEREMGLR